MLTIRRWHRWVATASAIFMLLISVTGLLLHVDLIWFDKNPPGTERPEPPPPPPLPSDEELAAMIVQIAQRARSAEGLEVRRLEIDLTPAGTRLVASPGGEFGYDNLIIDAVSGERIAPPLPSPGYHNFLQNLHAGYMFGWPGRIISILCGFALLVLGITGLQLWWKMRVKGRKGVFWK